MPQTKHVRWIDRAKAREILDAQAKSVLKIGADEFVKNFRAGKYRAVDADDCPGITELAMLAEVVHHPRGRNKSKRSGR